MLFKRGRPESQQVALAYSKESQCVDSANFNHQAVGLLLALYERSRHSQVVRRAL